ncbi:dihydrolipoamide acetyltransferase family protein [Bacillus salitolerans]|uniref:Dihydrolipoamide acetyltransferase component of pyruvate dehydrogenase complex n=1 Tax=Bacillus salitolerans TaxID=1437434 RepID=A0ABW4LQ63_9BACI
MEVKLHDIGEGMHEADITHFFVKPGDRVKADDPIVEVQTDKMTAEIPAPRAGIIKEITVEAGQTISVGTTVIIIEEDSPNQTVDVSTSSKTSNGVQTIQIPAPTSIETSSKKKRILASPYTRKLAREKGIDIELVHGTGPAGRITDEDVANFAIVDTSEIESLNNTSLEKAVQPESEKPKTQIVQNVIPYRGRRKQIGKKMQQSLYTVPHCTHFEEVDVTELIALREQLKKDGVNISATAFFIKALSLSLKEFPIFNARLHDEKEEIHLIHDHHVGLATDTEDGLVVPIIRNVEQKSLKQIHADMKELTGKAIENTLTATDVTGGTFTISNVGPLGGSIGATPIINHPEVGLMAFHKTKKMPIVNDKDEIVIRSMMNVSMSFDHRVVDGATAVKFTSYFAKLIGNPTFMLLEMI